MNTALENEIRQDIVEAVWDHIKDTDNREEFANAVCQLHGKALEVFMETTNHLGPWTWADWSELKFAVKSKAVFQRTPDGDNE